MGVGEATGCDCGSASVSCRSPSGCACCCSCNKDKTRVSGGAGDRGSSRGRSYCLRGERDRDLERDLERLLLLLLLPSFTSFLKLEEKAAAASAADSRAGQRWRGWWGAAPRASPVVRTLADLSAVVRLLLDGFGGGRVGRLLFHLDHAWRAGLGGRGEAAHGEGGRPVRVEALGLQLGLRQEHLPPLHLLLQLLIVGLQASRSWRLEWAGLCGTLRDSHLLPGVEPQRGDADLLDLLLGGSKQQVPVGPGRQRYLQRRAGLAGAQDPAAALRRRLVPAELGRPGRCRHRRWSPAGTSQTH